ncbi:GntR family transcriptional regulator [Salmonella enterica]|uniref:GntR family transcriptional regulator n=5 Tax=Salmonella enterica TaxID=28901 RepID=A0A7Z1PQ03_SALET|nr:GntR family transcriptional regulator [Salmonella enterica]ECA3794528.1 GntR family transcriptional regulator [Salmonella enterica subsp. enterica serovar Aqua]EEJ6656580.1 GntR family transcriptional regulator [Salmonella enterica subsp. enterica serovar Redlands]EAA8666964.1 GntR family transcriptional regulator [Salmonella enterica]EAA9928426.1 GntR family transcriptional regulator [Salmonella enterica]EAO9250978.1 GntR family transcriptional regulator [Salmonella enterica]
MTTINKKNTQHEKPISKKEIVYNLLRSRILNGVYHPGHKVTIDDISRELSFSNSPIREAINQLVAEGLLRIIPYSGAVVQLVNEEEYIEIMYVLGILDGAATSLTSMFITEKEIEQLEAINEEMKTSLDNFNLVKFSELNRQFHTFIYNKCGNQFLISSLDAIWQKISYGNNARFTFAQFRAKESILEHRIIIQMLKDKAPTNKIEEFLREHKKNMIDTIKSQHEQ